MQIINKALLATCFLLSQLNVFCQTPTNTIAINSWMLFEFGAIPEPVKINGVILNGDFTKEVPLPYVSKYKTRSGNDTTTIPSYYIGKIKDGFPVDKIEEYRGDKLYNEVYYNANHEVIKCIRREIPTPTRPFVKIINVEFLNKCPIKYAETMEGITTYSINYKEGQIIKVQEFYKDGKKKKEVTYIVNPNLKVSCNYVTDRTDILGLTNGELKMWKPNGNLEKTANYLNGELSGKSVEYYKDSGKIYSITNYANGKKQGKYILYSISEGQEPKLFQEGIYEQGKKVSYKIYKEDGTFTEKKD